MPVLKAKSSHVTIVDVARVSGFSPSTVSIVLNEAPLSRYVAAKTKERIRNAAKDLGYHPDAFARSLRSRRTHTIGVLIFDISDPFCTLILQGIERCLDLTAYLPIIMDAHNEQKQFEGYLEMLMERRVEGLIVVANWLFEEGGLLVNLQRNKLPTVVVGRDLSADDISSIIVDNVAGGYAAMEHLYSLGHRQIGVIRGPEKLSDSNMRWEGIQRFLSDHEFELDPRLVRLLPEALDPTSGFEGGVTATEDLLRSGGRFHRGPRLRRPDRARLRPRSQSCGAFRSGRLLGHRIRRCPVGRLLQPGAHHHPAAHGRDGQNGDWLGAPRRAEHRERTGGDPANPAPAAPADRARLYCYCGKIDLRQSSSFAIE